MRKHVFTAFLLLFAAASPAFADAGQDAALVPVHRFIDAMNAADLKAAESAYAPSVAIIDEFPPYLWRGKHAFARWFADGDAAAKRAKMSDQKLELDTPRSVYVSGTHAYAIVPARLDFKEDGRPVHETGTFTFTLTKTGQDWRIAAWAWTWASISK